MKKIKNKVKLQIKPGNAKPVPPIASALGQKGVNIMDFCKKFNKITIKNNTKLKLPVIITINDDKSFNIKVKSPTTMSMINERKKIIKNDSENKRYEITEKDLEEIAKIKLNDTNAYNELTCKKIVEGTAKSMKVKIQKKK